MERQNAQRLIPEQQMAINIPILLEWFDAQCDGDWEHQFGWSIVTLDNPGVYIKIDLDQTYLAKIPLEEIEVENSDNDWCSVRKIDNGLCLEGAGSTSQMDYMIKVISEYLLHDSKLIEARKMDNKNKQGMDGT